MSCVYLSTREKNLKKSLDGLLFADGFLQLDKSAYVCCDSIGQFEKNKEVFVCGLNKSLEHARQALKGVYAIHKRFKLKSKSVPISLQKSLENISQGRAFRGKFFKRTTKDKQDFMFDDVALAAAWLYGIEVYLVKIGVSDIFKVVKKIQDKASSMPVLILVKGLKKVSNPSHLQDFMVLADFAYNSMFPLWVEVLDGGISVVAKTASENPRSFKTKISSKVQKPFMEQLPMATREKLVSFCKEINYKDYMNDETKT